MNLVQVATITDQTFLITPRYAGQLVRLGTTDYTATGDEVPVRVYGTGPVSLGEGWWDQMLIVDGNYTGPYFDGNSADSELVNYSWAGPPDASASVWATRTKSSIPEGDATYYPKVDGYRRYLHAVHAISGPLTQQDAVSTDGVHYGKLVEFTLNAGVPWVYGVPAEVALPPIVPTVVQDIAYNLAPYPSAELAGAAVVVATNYATNPSVETDASVWALTADGAVILAANCALSRTTELFSVGTASVKNTFTAPGASTGAGYLGVAQLVTGLPTATGTRVSINVWGAGNIQSGTAVLGSIQVFADWANAGGILRTDTLGTIAGGSGALSAKSVLPPAGADRVTVRVRQNVTSFAAGAVLRVYADALAVTVP